MPKNTGRLSGQQGVSDRETRPKDTYELPRYTEKYLFTGGVDTYHEEAQLTVDRHPTFQNIRKLHPGIRKRYGCIKLHTTADSTNKVMSLYQLSKGKKVEMHMLAQMSDSDILMATTNPPGVTNGAFGSEVFSGTASPVPASWATLDDFLLFSNGVDQHQIWPGEATNLMQFIVYKGAAAMPRVPEIGEDYTKDLNDEDSTSVAILDDLDTAANFNWVVLKTHVSAKQFTVTVNKPNGTDSVLTMEYYKNDNTWAAVAITDNTADGGATLAKSGTITWTAPADIMPVFMFGSVGYCYRWKVSAKLDAEVELSAVTYEADWSSIVNNWDGIPTYPAEVQVYVHATTTYRTYDSTVVELGALTANDKVYFNAVVDDIDGFYVEVGSLPNTTGSRSINAVYYWDGNSFESVGTIADGTEGLQRSGWVTFGKVTCQPSQFGKNKAYGKWFYFTVNNTLSGTDIHDIRVGITLMPRFDLTELGKGLVNCAWKDRGCYVFTNYPNYIYVTPPKQPQVLNGDDSAILMPGDGRRNKAICMKNFYNELMVWQEEKGTRGGCLTIFEGYNPSNFGRLVLSTKLGTFNANSATIVEGAVTNIRTDKLILTVAVWISHYGIFMTDGTTIKDITGDIKNYFDPNETECIRRGYEDRMWAAYDSSHQVVRFGLVSGASATECNIFPVYDLEDGTWSFDVLGQEFACLTEVEAASGNDPILQVGGGTDDGYVYLSNSTLDDVSTPISWIADLVFRIVSFPAKVRDLILACKVQAAGSITIAPYKNGVAQTGGNKTMSMTALETSEVIHRERINFNIVGDYSTYRLSHNTAAQDVVLYDVLFDYEVQDGR